MTGQNDSCITEILKYDLGGGNDTLSICGTDCCDGQTGYNETNIIRDENKYASGTVTVKNFFSAKIQLNF